MGVKANNDDCKPLPGTATVGVCLPARNAEQWLERCLGPMLRSSLKPRILVIDSSSTDRTVEVAKRLGAETITIPQREFNHGATRELGRKLLGTDIVVMITHDLGIIAEMADEVAVMYASKVVEQAPVRELYANPKHPYTHGLFASRPRPGMPKGERLYSIHGMVPSPLKFPAGCKFHPRCPFAEDRCRTEEPTLRSLSPVQQVRCHFAETIDFTKPREITVAT